jgi:hypothetical protein
MRNTIMFAFLAIALSGCGSGSTSNSTQSNNPDPTPTAQPWNIAGPWQFALTSNTNPGTYRVLNVNLSQTDTNIYTVTQSATMVQIVSSVVEFMDDCSDTNGSGDSLSGTLGTPSTVGSSPASNLSFTFTENGDSLSEQIAVTGQMFNPQPDFYTISGTYTMSGGCAQADTGSMVGSSLNASSATIANYFPGYYGGFGVSNIGEFSLGGIPLELTVYQNQIPWLSVPVTMIGGQLFIAPMNGIVPGEIEGLYLPTGNGNWATILGTIYQSQAPPAPISAWYLVENGISYEKGVYFCSAEAPAGTPNCQ